MNSAGRRHRLRSGTALLVRPSDLLTAVRLMDEAGLRGRERSALLALLALADPTTGMVFETNTEIMRTAGYASTSAYGSGHAHGTLQRLQLLGLIARGADGQGRIGWLLNPVLASRPSGPGLLQQKWAEFQLWQAPRESPAVMNARLLATRLRNREWHRRRREKQRALAATTEQAAAA